MFNLPEGYTAQVRWHQDFGNTCYELNQVYDPAGRLDRERSFWLVTPLDQQTPAVMHQINYGAYKALYGDAACSFDDFAIPSQRPAPIHEWLRRMPALPGNPSAPSL